MTTYDNEYFRPLWNDFDGELFQDLVCDLLSAEGFRVEPSGVGPDGGIDAFAEQEIKFGYNNPEPFSWAIQCKYSSNPKKSVSPSEVGPIHNIVNSERFRSKNIKGFFLATNGRLSTNMMSELRGLNTSFSGVKTTYWDRSRIHDVLERNFAVYKKYFLPPDGVVDPDGGSPTRPSAPTSSFTNAELREFETLINSHRTREVEILAFLESHPHFLAIGDTNVDIFPEIVLENPEGVLLRPGFLIRHKTGRFVDVIELKRPAIKIVARGGRRPVLTTHLIQAIAQLRKYQNAFAYPLIRENFEKKYGIQVYRPQLTLVVGRSTEFSGETDRQKMQSQISDVTLLTYDDLLESGKHRFEKSQGK